jgi:hypothetical protein
MKTARMLSAGLALVGAALALAPAAHAAQIDLELFAPAREAARAVQAARHARAAELAPKDLRLADLYIDDATAALRPASGQPDVEKATFLFRLAAAQAKVAETRSVEVVREREAGGAGDQYLRALEFDPQQRYLPGSPTLPGTMTDYRRSQEEAAQARAARRLAEEELERVSRARPR